MKTILFPHALRPLGWILFIPTLVLGILVLTGIVSFSGEMETICNDAAIIGITIGALLITCSHERIEDEMTRTIRLASLLNSIYIWVILLIASTLLINGIDYLNFMAINLVLLPVIFVILFRLEMNRYLKMSEDEE